MSKWSISTEENAEHRFVNKNWPKRSDEGGSRNIWAVNPPFIPLMLHSAAVVQWLGNTTEAVQWQHQQRGQQRETAGSSFRPKLHLFTGTQTLAHVVIFTKSFIYTRHVNNISQRVQFELFRVFFHLKAFKNHNSFFQTEGPEMEEQTHSLLVVSLQLQFFFFFFCVWNKACFLEPARRCKDDERRWYTVDMMLSLNACQLLRFYYFKFRLREAGKASIIHLLCLLLLHCRTRQVEQQLVISTHPMMAGGCQWCVSLRALDSELWTLNSELWAPELFLQLHSHSFAKWHICRHNGWWILTCKQLHSSLLCSVNLGLLLQMDALRLKVRSAA